MKKQELIHLHGLLAEVSSYCSSDVTIDLEDYKSLGVRPTSIHQSKTDHKAAVFALADGITTHFDIDPAEEPEAIPTTVSSAD